MRLDQGIRHFGDIAVTDDREAESIRRLAMYVDKHTLPYYEQWMRDSTPAIDPARLAEAAMFLLQSDDERIARSAMQALASFGDAGCLAEIRASRVSQANPDEFQDILRHVKVRTMTPEDLLEEVHDEQSFLLFVRCLARERRTAHEMEAADPERYVIDGALGWKNADIASFLEAADSAGGRSPSASWRWFAEFLYNGKVVE